MNPSSLKSMIADVASSIFADSGIIRSTDGHHFVVLHCFGLILRGHLAVFYFPCSIVLFHGSVSRCYFSKNRCSHLVFSARCSVCFSAPGFSVQNIWFCLSALRFNELATLISNSSLAQTSTAALPAYRKDSLWVFNREPLCPCKSIPLTLNVQLHPNDADFEYSLQFCLPTLLHQPSKTPSFGTLAQGIAVWNFILIWSTSVFFLFSYLPPISTCCSIDVKLSS